MESDPTCRAFPSYLQTSGVLTTGFALPLPNEVIVHALDAFADTVPSLVSLAIQSVLLALCWLAGGCCAGLLPFPTSLAGQQDSCCHGNMPPAWHCSVHLMPPGSQGLAAFRCMHRPTLLSIGCN